MADIKQVDLLVQIADTWISVDLDKSTTFPFNLQIGDFTNPTVTKISFSSQISIPKSKTNDDIFANIGEYTARAIDGKINYIRRTPFLLYVAGNIYQSGYIQVESVTLLKYNIRLYNDLGDFFYSLSEISETSDMRLSSLDFGGLFNHQINGPTVYSYWNGQPLQGTYYDNSYKRNVTEGIFTYAMTYQGKYDNFDSDSVIGFNEETGVEEPLPVTWYDITGKEYTAPNLNEHYRSTQDFSGEYRSYYQKPMIKFSVLYNKIIDRAKENGWNVELDETFFNNSNPYYSKTWVLLPQYDTTSDVTQLNVGVSPVTYGPYYYDNSGDSEWVNVNIGDASNIIAPGKIYSVGANITYKIRAHTDGVHQYLMLKRGQMKLQMRLVIGGEIYNLIDSSTRNTPLVLNESTVGGKRDLDDFYYDKRGEGMPVEVNSKSPKGDIYTFIANNNLKFDASGITTSPNIILQLRIEGDTWWKRYSNGNNRGFSASIEIQPDAFISFSDERGQGIHTDADIEYRNIMQSEYTCYDFLTSYNKIFGLMYIHDSFSKTVRIVTRNTFYGNQERLDWTYKIDYSKEHSTSLAKFDYRNGIFKWGENDTKYEERYRSLTGKEYGSLTFDNGYEFSDKQNDYIENNIFNNVIIATDYSQYYLNRSNTLYKDNKVLPYMQDVDGGYVDTGMSLVFLDGYNTVEKRFAISDDDTAMLTYGYCWTNRNIFMSSRYPNITRIITEGGVSYSLNFGRPSEIYNDNETAALSSSTEGDETIYYRFWKAYLSDIFSEHNRVLTCYVDIKLTDVYTNLFNKFIFIQNTPYVLNKISGFDPLTPATTKVELVSVQNIDAYISQSYIAGSMQLTNNGITIYDSNGTNGVQDTSPVILRYDNSARTVILGITLDPTSLRWSITNDDQMMVIIPENGTSGNNINITIPANNTGSSRSYLVPIRWGNTTTIVQIVQGGSFTINTSANPSIGGITSATDGITSGPSISVEDGASVTLSVTPSPNYILQYWIINGDIYNTASPVITANSDIEAVAYLYDAVNIIRLDTSDEFTIIYEEDSTIVPKEGSYYWLLNTSDNYLISNNQDNLSGYMFESDGILLDPEQTFLRAFDNNDILTVYYDTLLVNVTIINNSSTNFDSGQLRITTPSDIPVSIFGGNVSPGVTVDRKIIYPTTEYGLYTISSLPDAIHDISFSQNTISYTQGSAIQNITITISDHFEPEISIDPTTKSVGANIEMYTIDLTCNTTWRCVIDPIYDGVVNVSPLFGEGDTTVNVTTGVNPTGQTRVGIATFETTFGNDDKFVNHTVTQRPLDGVLTVNFTNTTGAAITPATPIIGSIIRTSNNSIVEQFDVTSVPAGGINYEFEDIAEGNYSVSLSSYSGATASGTYSVLPANAQSIGVIGGQTTGVSFGMGSATSRQLILTPEAVATGSILNNFTIQVVASAGLTWSLSDNASWLSCSPTTGTGTTTINVTVAANILGSRQAVITATSTSGTPVLQDVCNVSQTGII